jgi:Zn-dependent peptidase ImmA (M78 family)
VSDRRPIREGVERAVALRIEHRLGAAPIRNVPAVIEDLRPDAMVIRRPMPGGPAGALVGMRDRWLVIVNTHERVLREQRDMAAHLLGHLLLDPGSRRLHVENDLFDDGTPAEVRAAAFATNWLVPVSAIAGCAAAWGLESWAPEHLAAVSMEYGISVRALVWQLLHTSTLAEADRRRVAGAGEASPEDTLRLASRMGMSEYVRSGLAARGAVAWPRRYVALVARAYDRGDLGRTEVERLLEDDALVRQLTDLRSRDGSAAGP